LRSVGQAHRTRTKPGQEQDGESRGAKGKVEATGPSKAMSMRWGARTPDRGALDRDRGAIRNTGPSEVRKDFRRLGQTEPLGDGKASEKELGARKGDQPDPKSGHRRTAPAERLGTRGQSMTDDEC
jgi:hypothetical protein